MKKGFTLIELLIVITIIGILAVAFLPSLLGAPAKARDTQRMSDVTKIAAVLTNQTIAGAITGGCVGPDANNLSGKILAPDFGGKIPNDPSYKSTVSDRLGGCPGYVVLTDATGTPDYNFGVFAKLENTTGNLAAMPTVATTTFTTDVTLATGGQYYAVLIQ